MDQTAIQKALAELDVPGLKVVADAKDAETMEKSAGCTIKFPEALKLAVDAFLNNAQGSENGSDSVAGLLMDTPEQHGLQAKPSAADVSAKLREYLKTDQQAAAVLLTKATLKQDEYRFPPEYGESVEKNWVFRILLPATLGILIWAIVDKTGKKAGYCYAVE